MVLSGLFLLWAGRGWQHTQTQHVTRPDAVRIFYLGIQSQKVLDGFRVTGIVQNMTKHAVYYAGKRIAILYFVLVGLVK